MTDLELAEEIERLSREFEALAANKGGKIEHRAVAAAKLESTLMVNRDQIIAALRRADLAQAEIKGHMRTEDDLKADYVRAREFIEQQSTRIAELEGALGNAVEALHNDFEPDNQSRAYHAARNALKARA